MKSIELNFYERIILWARLGSAQMPTLNEASLLLKVHNKIRPTEEERKEYDFHQKEQNIQWNISANNIKKLIELEDEESSALLRNLEGNGAVPVAVKDVEWMLNLTEKLKDGNATQK